MTANAKMWLIALGAGLAGALVGAGLVWATQQSTVASLSAQVIKIEADTQAATTRAKELQTELDAVKSSAAQSQAASAPSAPSPSVAPKTPTSTSVKQFSYVKTVTGSSTRPVITADYAQMLSGDAAAAAATAHGDESPPPNDYYIVNDSKKLRKLPVRPGISVTVTTNSDGTSDPTGHAVTFADWAAYFSAPTAENEGIRTAPYWLTVKNGIVIKIVQQYLP